MNANAVIVKGTTEDVASKMVDVGAKSIVVVVDITAGAGSLVVTIKGVTPSGYKYPLLVSSSLSGVSTTPLRIFPGATPSSNAVANDVVPATIEISVDVTGVITYGIDIIEGE